MTKSLTFICIFALFASAQATGGFAGCGFFAFFCGNTTTDAVNQPLAGCECCCNYGFTPLDDGSCGCEPAAPTPTGTPQPTPFTCGVFSFQCDAGIAELPAACDGCCCQFGYIPIGSTCECEPAPTATATATPTAGPPTATPTPTRNVCGNQSFQCLAGSTGNPLACDGCCCEFGFSPVASTCGCSATPTPTAAPPTATAVPTPTAVSCGANAFQCSAASIWNTPACPGCCCYFGAVTTGSGCACAFSNTPTPVPTPTAVAAQQCGSNAHQCGAGSTWNPLACPGCCCNFGTAPTTGCACGATPTPTPTTLAQSTSCGALSFQCGSSFNSADNQRNPACPNCCCFYKKTPIGGQCACQ